jgi:Pregnancy-associated plasma protein-A
MRPVGLSLALIGLLGATLGTAGSGAVASPQPAKQSVAQCDSVSNDRVMRGRQNGSDPNDLTRAETQRGQQQMTAKLLAKGLSWSSKLPLARARIDVRWHVITRSDGTGGVTRAQIADQLAVLNAAYGGRSARQDAPTIFRFVTKSIDRTANDDWYDWSDPDVDPSDDQEAKAALHRGGSDDLNVYIAALGDGLLGYSEFPFDTTLVEDGVVILNDSLPGGSAVPYNEGDTLTHEVGHWLGLFHTFENGCVAPGDSVADTPYQNDGDNIFSCDESLDTCPAPGKDPVHNFMSYGDDPCLDRFSFGQSLRMALVWFAYRA